MRRGLDWSERLKAPMMVSHQGARFQMGTERIQEGSPSLTIKLRISIIQLVPGGSNGASESEVGTGEGGEAMGPTLAPSTAQMAAGFLTTGGDGVELVVFISRAGDSSEK